MGSVRFGVPQELALKLAERFGLRYFVETGTYRAGTACWASQYFEQVWTIEAWGDYHRRAASAHQDKPNISFIFGDSRTKLGEVLAGIHEPALVWLDAHWLKNAEESVGGEGECPIREELAALNASGQQHFILIDDARCFTGNKTPRWVTPGMWPRLPEIKGLLPGYYVVVHEDVIIAVPPAARQLIEEHMQLPEVSVLVLTSNDYVHILPAFSYLFNKYWSSDQPVTVLRYDVRPPVLPGNFYTPSAGRQADYSFSGGVRAYLENVYVGDLLVLMLDDYFLSAPVDTARIRDAWELMRRDAQISKIDLSGDLTKRRPEEYSPELVRAPIDDPFRGSLQAAIWRADYLLEACQEERDPWNFEKHTCKDGLILGVKTPLLHYVNAVGGRGRKAGQYDHRKIPAAMWAELQRVRLV